MLISKQKIFLYIFLLLLLFQGKGFSADNNIFRELTEKGVATYEDGCRAISYFTNVDEKNLTFDELVSALKEKGIIGKRWKYKAEKSLTRGEIAYMGCKVLKIRGGLTMRVMDTTRFLVSAICTKLKISDSLSAPDIGMYKRYAYLEFLGNGLLPEGHNKEFLTGHDLLASMYRIEQHIKAEDLEEKQKEERRKEGRKAGKCRCYSSRAKNYARVFNSTASSTAITISDNGKFPFQ